MSRFEPTKTRSRRNEIRADVRKRQPAPQAAIACALRDPKTLLVLCVAGAFVLLCGAILMLRPQVITLRPGQRAYADVASRVGFDVLDAQQLQRARERARDAEPRVYRAADADPLDKLQAELLALPAATAKLSLEQLDEPARSVLDEASLTKLHEIAEVRDGNWAKDVARYIQLLRGMNLVLIPAERRAEDWQHTIRLADDGGRRVVATEQTLSPLAGFDAASAGGQDEALTPRARAAMAEAMARKFKTPAADALSPLLYPKMLDLTLASLGPTHVLDEATTAKTRQAAADAVPDEAGLVSYRPGQVLVPAGRTVDEADWDLLRTENVAFRSLRLGKWVWVERAGLVGCVLMLTVALALYCWRFQPRVLQNPVRATGLAVTLIGALLVAQLAGIGKGNLTLLGVGPVILVAMTLCVAYDGRFALGVGGILALLVTLALNASIGFYLICFAGLLATGFLLNDVRSRSKLIEVGGVTALCLGGAAVVVGMLRMDPLRYTLVQGAYASLAGLGSGFFVLGILPTIEKAFKITTGMTLLEYQNHPLLRRLALEAPGTYNHSLQVASICEDAAAAIGADALLCRTACYYHDIGKLRKPHYFVENQAGGENRHLNLNPSMSLLVIIGHVKDGVEMAKEYGLPRAFLPFIQQHHGTTLVEYFYREACQRQQQKLAEGNPEAAKEIADCDYRYPGPKPRSKETAILMMADTCESATRAMTDPTPARIEGRVNDLFQKRLLDGQFDESPLTLADLDQVRKSIVKSLRGIYHGRIQYPDDKAPSLSGLLTPAPEQAKVG